MRDAQHTLHDLVFPNTSQLVVCKLSSLLSQSDVQEMLKGFVYSDIAQVNFVLGKHYIYMQCEVTCYCCLYLHA